MYNKQKGISFRKTTLRKLERTSFSKCLIASFLMNLQFVNLRINIGIEVGVTKTPGYK